MARRTYFTAVSPTQGQTPTTAPGTRAPLLNAKRVSERLGCTPWTVYRLMRDHKLPYITVGATYRFDQDDIEAWIAARRTVNGEINALQLVARR